jgi:hypothetical protein
MKRLHLFIVLLAVLMTACENDSLMLNESANPEVQLREGSIEDQIDEFIDRMDDVRDDPECEDCAIYYYNSDAAIWNLEAAVNCLYTYPTADFGAIEVDSVIIIINESESGFNIKDLQEGFDSLLYSIACILPEIDEDAFVYSIDLQEVESDEGLNILASIAVAVPNVPLPDIDWKVYHNSSSCNNTYSGYGAPEKIELMEHDLFPPANDCYIYHTIVTAQNASGLGVFVPYTTPQANPFGFNSVWLFSETYVYNQGGTECLSSDPILEYYAYNLNYVKNNHSIATSTSKEPIVCDVFWTVLWHANGIDATQMHEVNIQYGLPVTCYRAKRILPTI